MTEEHAVVEAPLQRDDPRLSSAPGNDNHDGIEDVRDRRALVTNLALVLGVYVVSRAVAFAAIVLGTRVRPDVTLPGALQYWDAAWYLRVAAQGYPHAVPEHAGQAIQSEIAFFPVYPMAVRGVQRLSGLTMQEAGVLVAVLSGAAAAVVLWLLLERLSGAAAAHRGVAAFCFFPASFAMLLPMAEGMAIAFSAACLLFLVSRRWVPAGLAAALATATRPTSVVLVACCAVAALTALRHDREWRALAAPLLAPLGLLAFFAFLWARTGEAAVWFRVEREGWGQGSDFGITTVRALRTVFADPLVDLNALAAVAAFLFSIGAAVALWRWRPPVVVLVYGFAVLFLATTSGIASRPRYLLSGFPVVVACGVMARREASFGALVGGFGVLLGAYALTSTVTTTMVF